MIKEIKTLKKLNVKSYNFDGATNKWSVEFFEKSNGPGSVQAKFPANVKMIKDDGNMSQTEIDKLEEDILYYSA